MELTNLLEIVNNTDAWQTLANTLGDATPINDWMKAGSNPLIPDRPDSNLPVIRIFR